ncbi:MAG TPA: hypothetical protein VKB52_14245 [Rhodanobacteraceae bacterium]|nr:hypothetical protein [Rhodanobacteraceae bacterium]
MIAARALGLIVGVSLAFSPALAGEPALKPGKYDGLHGTLTIQQQKDRTLSFELTVVSSVGDICGLEGRIEHLRARLSLDAEGSGEKNVCVVDFKPSADGIEIATNDLDCQQFCGAGASYEIVEGLYTPDAAR